MIKLEGNQKLDIDKINALIGLIKVILYARVSTDDQALHGYSLESQVERTKKFAMEKYKCSEDEIIAIVEMGESGDNADRVALNYALSLLEMGIGKYIVFLHPNRMARDLNLQTYLSTRIWNAGCTFDFVESSFDKDNPESMLMFNIQGSIAQYNKTKINSDSRRGRRQKASNGKISGMNRLYGYTFDKDTDMLVINEEEKDIILSMVDMLINKNYSCSRIAQEMSIKGYIAPNGGQIWYQTTTSRILKNESYTGKYYYGKTEVLRKNGVVKQIKKERDNWIAIPIPQIIDVNTFMLLQDKISSLSKRKSGRPSDHYLLRGLAKCGRCGGALCSGTTSKGKGSLIKYYTCVNKSKKSFKVGTGESNVICKGKNWRVDVIDTVMWNELISKLKNPDKVIEQIVELQGDSEKLNRLNIESSNLTKLIKEKEEERQRFIFMFSKGIIKSIDELESNTVAIEKQIKILNDDLTVVEGNIRHVTSSNDDISKIKEIMNKINISVVEDKLSSEEKKVLLKSFIRKIVLMDDGTIDVVWKFFHNSPPTDDGNRRIEVKEKHNNAITSEVESLGFYVSESLNNFKPKWGGEGFNTKHSALQPQLDKLVKMYHEELLTFEEIADKVKIDWWQIKNLFKYNNIVRISTKERAKIKREENFNFLYDLHFTQGISMNQIYKDHKFSPPYIRAVFKDKNISPRK